ncbi:MAG: DUF4433 domain-containing protein [Akkermansiaceae bacterium]|nr:DUF4433 domain-containing protein [Akkermansiaceae bacterium]
MEYRDIIRKNCEQNSPVFWWPRFAYHCTDVQNAVSILSSGRMLCRASAKSHNIMKRDNASRQVIELTDKEVVSHVRFYFRPKTQTYYYQEGFKHRDLRFRGDENVNIPVPVFLLFDLERLLSHPGVEFSDKTQAGSRGDTFQGIEAFAKLKFDYIYDQSWEGYEQSKKYRQAEILAPDSFAVDGYISRILCRNAVERATLLNLLKKSSSASFEKYKDIIREYSKDVFYENGIFVATCDYCNKTVSISFSESPACSKYIEKAMRENHLNDLSPIQAIVELEWLDKYSNIIKIFQMPLSISMQHPSACKINGVPLIKDAVHLGIKVYFEGQLMSYVIRSLQDTEVLD